MNRRMMCMLSVCLGLAAGALGQESKAPAAKKVPDIPEIKLIDAGKGDKKELRYKPKAGAAETVAVTMKFDFTQNGQTMANTMKWTLALKVDEVKSNGDIQYSGELTKVDPTVSGAVGMKVKYMMSNRGIISVADYSGANQNPQIDNVIENLQDSLSQCTTPVPAEAIGVGAKWTSTTHPLLNNAKTEMVTTYTLTEMTKEGAKVIAEVVQTAKEQDVDAGAGAKAKLTSLSGTGKGTSEFAFDRVAPTSAEGTMDVDLALHVTAGEKSMDMKQKCSIAATLKGASGAEKPAEAKESTAPKK